MNYGILHNRRHERKGAGGGGGNPLLADARMCGLAKQMGLEPQDFGKEAMNVWSMLDEMAENDPTAYQSFINEQLKQGPPSKGSSSEQDASAPATRLKTKHFYPTPGYVAKCTMKTAQQEPQKLFLNLCSHEIVDIPKNPNSNREVPRDPRAVPTTSNLQIPLVTGALREIKDFSGGSCGAIDVVFHPWVLERCVWDASFKLEVLKLALHWVQHDAHVQLQTPVGKYIKSQYKGGATMGDEIITAKFVIDPEQPNGQHESCVPDSEQAQSPHQSNQENTAPSNTRSIDSPADLLKQINLLDAGDEENEFLIAPVGEQKPARAPRSTSLHQEINKPSDSGRSKVPLIEVIEPKKHAINPGDEVSGCKTEPRERISRKTKTATKTDSRVVKKGFLNSTKASLYPNGSSEGRPSSAYVNLLSRSKVVDMNEIKPPAKQSPQQHGHNVPKATAESNKTASSHEKDHGDHEFEQLCIEADPDLKPAAHRGGTSQEPVFGDQLGDFAKFLNPEL